MAKRKTSENLISLIVPVYHQEKTIYRDLKRIKKVMDQLMYEYELIVVIDGTDDKSYQNAKKLRSKYVTVIGYEENKGKGHAIQLGMAKSRGDIVAFIDSGMDLNPQGLSMLLSHMQWYGADIIVGSKLHPVSKVNYPLFRRVLSWGYRTLVRVLFGLSVRDTQVGMKFFKRDVLEDVLPRLLVKTFAFDIEILAVAHYLGYTRIYEAPIELDFTGVSTMSSKKFWRTIAEMLWDTCAVFYRLRILHYYDRPTRKTRSTKKRLS